MTEKKCLTLPAWGVAMPMLRRSLVLAMVVLFIGAVGNAQSLDEIRLSITKDVTDEIAHGQTAFIVEYFSPELKYSITEDQMDMEVNQLIALVGAFRGQLSLDTRTVNGVPVYISTSQFERFKVELGLAFDTDNQITHVWIAPVSDFTQDDLEASAKTTADLLWQERFDLLGLRFNDQLKTAISPDDLEMSRSLIVQHLGEFKSIKLARKDPVFDIVDVMCEFERGEITVRVAFDLSGKVRGLWMMPVESEDDSYEKT